MAAASEAFTKNPYSHPANPATVPANFPPDRQLSCRSATGCALMADAIEDLSATKAKDGLNSYTI